jgi:hypothetical protein
VSGSDLDHVSGFVSRVHQKRLRPHPFVRRRDRLTARWHFFLCHANDFEMTPPEVMRRAGQVGVLGAMSAPFEGEGGQPADEEKPKYH